MQLNNSRIGSKFEIGWLAGLMPLRYGYSLRRTPCQYSVLRTSNRCVLGAGTNPKKTRATLQSQPARTGTRYVVVLRTLFGSTTQYVVRRTVVDYYAVGPPGDRPKSGIVGEKMPAILLASKGRNARWLTRRIKRANQLAFSYLLRTPYCRQHTQCGGCLLALAFNGLSHPDCYY